MLGQLLQWALDVLWVVVNLVSIVVLVHVLISWLVAFDVVSPRTQAISTISGFTGRIVEPMLRPIQRFVPRIGGVDLSPLILLISLPILMRLIEILLGPIIRGPL